MSESLGQLVDRISIINQKTWDSMERIYRIRRMTWEEFQEFFATEEGCREVYDYIKKSCDLNVQRSQLIKEFDSKLVNMIQRAVSGEDIDDGTSIQDQHKTY